MAVGKEREDEHGEWAKIAVTHREAVGRHSEDESTIARLKRENTAIDETLMSERNERTESSTSL